MKRSFVIVIPLLLLILLNACDINRGALPPYSNAQWTAIAKTQQVMAQPHNERIRNLLNRTLDYDRFSQFEEKVVGNYDITGVDFPYGTYFQIHMNCQCIDGSSCCDRRRMFFVAVWRMYLSKYEILVDVPDTVQNLDVVCYNNTAPFAVVEAPWGLVKDFLYENRGVSASDLASSVTSRKMP
jgi:hypothetical protein